MHKKILAFLIACSLILGQSYPFIVYAKNDNNKQAENEIQSELENDDSLSEEEKAELKEDYDSLIDKNENGEFEWTDDNREMSVMSWENTDWSDYENKLNLPWEITGRAQAKINKDIYNLFGPILNKEIATREAQSSFTEGAYSGSYSGDSYCVLLLAMINELAEECGAINETSDGDPESDNGGGTGYSSSTALTGPTTIAQSNPEEDTITVSSATFAEDTMNESFQPVTNTKLIKWSEGFGYLLNPLCEEGINNGVKMLFTNYCQSVEEWCKCVASIAEKDTSSDKNKDADKNKDKNETTGETGEGDDGEIAEPYPNKADDELFSVVQGAVTLAKKTISTHSFDKEEVVSYSTFHTKYTADISLDWQGDNKEVIINYLKSEAKAKEFIEKYKYKPNPEFALNVSKIYSAFSGFNTVNVDSKIQKYLEGAQYPESWDGVKTPTGKIAEFLSVAGNKLDEKTSYVWGAKGPNNFDCSGFCYWCMKQIGIKNPPGCTAEYPGSSLKEIPKEEALPGDILIKTSSPRHAMICLKAYPGKKFDVLHSTNHGGKSGVQITNGRSWGRVDKVYRWWHLVDDNTPSMPSTDLPISGLSSNKRETFLNLNEYYSNYIKAHHNQFYRGFNAGKSFGKVKTRIENGRNVGISCVVPYNWALVSMGIITSGSAWVHGGYKNEINRTGIKNNFVRISGKKPCGMTLKKALKKNLVIPGDIISWKGGKPHNSVYRGIRNGTGTIYSTYDAGSGMANKDYKTGIVTQEDEKNKIIDEILRWK